MKSNRQKSPSSDSDTSSDSDLNDKRQNAKSEVSDTKLAGQRPVSAHTDSSGVAGGKQAREEKAGKEKSPSRQAVAQERIRAKLLAISVQSAAEVKKTRPAQSSRDTKTSSHARSPSPKRHTHSHNRRSFHRSHPAARRSRSRNGRRHRHSRDDRSRSRSAGRSHQRHRDHRHRHSHDRHARRHRSHDRRHSRSRSPSKPKNFKEQLKAQLFSTSQPITPAAAAVTLSSSGLTVSTSLTASTATSSAIALEAKKLLSANEKPSNLPLFASNPLSSSAQQGLAQKVTPQQALAQTMAAMHQKAQQMTGVAVPSYYNPAAVNPLKYAEQLKKRKMLWSKPGKDAPDKEKEADSKTVQSVAQWTGTSFAADEDGKVAAKFRKLMGIREEDKALLDDNVDLSKLTEEQRRRQEELFAQLDKEYAFARMTTHTCRGLGLGFQSQGLPDT